MGYRVVKQPNGKLAIFSSVVDDFVLYNAPVKSVVDYFVEAAVAEARERVKRLMAKATGEKFSDCIEEITMVHGEERAKALAKVCAKREKTR